MKIIDQMNRTIRLGQVPERIVSLVPSQTEFLYALGLGDRVVGITKFCIHPKEWFESKNRIGGTKNANPEKIKELKPDLIIGNKEENDKENIAEIESIAPLYMSDIYTLDDAYKMMLDIGEIVGLREKAEEIVEQIKINFSELSKLKRKQKVVYLIWRKPYMGVGKSTFVHHLLTDVLGLENCLSEERYPEVDFDVEGLNPELVLLSSEPYPFGEKHIEEIQLKLPNAKIQLVDGEFFSWYGSRLLGAPNYFKTIFRQ